MSFTCGKETKLLTIKSVNVNDLDDVYRVDLEANKQGLLICNSNGILRIISWINKKLDHKEKVLENVSDALWQQGGEGEVIITCESGALLRYNLHYDTGITCSLQLSAPSMLQIVKNKDASISSLKHTQICGHTNNYILLQPQSDRLIVLETNSGDRPNLLGVLKVPPVRTAYLIEGKILVQPITGCELHIFNAATCKASDIVSMTYPLCDTVYKEWGRLSCAPQGSYICLTDSERKLYLGTLTEKVPKGKKGGVPHSSVTLNQIVWPSSIKPIFFSEFTITCSEEAISVFCSKIVDGKDASSYLLCKLKENRSLSSIHNFTEDVVIIPTLASDFQDYFLTNNGMSMLIDKESSSGLSNLGSDMKKLLVSLEKAFDSRDMNIVAEIKSTIEQDLSIFISSCNYKDGWLQEAETRCEQHSQLADLILSHLMSLSASPEDRGTMIILKEMAEHHFQKLQEEMENAFEYVDSKNVSQMLLQMVEQLRFFIQNINDIKYPEDVKEEKEILENFEKWKGKTVQEIVKSALENGSVSTAESYLQMKPWIYGKLNTDTLISICLNIAQDCSSVEILFNLDKNYTKHLKARLCSSRDVNEIRVLSAVLRHWNALDDQEKMSIHLIQGLLSTFPTLVSKPLKFWFDLVTEGEKKRDPFFRELSVGAARKWNSNTIMLLLCDLYARTNEPGVISYVTSESLWHYFLLRSDEPMIRKWISNYFNICSNFINPLTVTWTNDEVLGVSNYLSQYEIRRTVVPQRERKVCVGSNRLTSDTRSLLGHSAYDSDNESLSSFSRSSLSGSLEDLSRTQELSAPYVNVTWNQSYFHELNQNMVDMIQSVQPNFAQNLLNFLSQFNIFLSSEKNNMEDIFRRRINSKQEINCKSEQFKEKFSGDQISLMVLRKYSSLRLYLPFYEYVRTENLSSTDFELHLPDDQWFHLANWFLIMSSSPLTETLFASATKSLEYLISVRKTDSILLPAFLTMLVSSCTSLKNFVDNPVADASESEHNIRFYSCLEALDLTPKSLVEKLSTSYPFLSGLIDNKLRDRLDITVYDLLRGNVTFDISTLFNWQEQNSLGFQSNSQLPDFLDKTLCEIEGAKFSLDYIYYLRKGRPTKALFSTYADIYENKNLESVSEVESNIYGLALSSWPDRRICSACVVFLFLSGSDCNLLRSILHAADIVLQLLKRNENNYLQREISLITQEIKEVLLQLCCKFSRKVAASRFIAIVEETMVRVMSPSEKSLREQNRKLLLFDMPIAENKMFDLVNCLKICNFLAHRYEVDPPQHILQAIARNNLWPVFLALIQGFQYPKHIILRLATHFSSVPLREHVSYALSNVHRYRGNSEISETPRRSRNTLCREPTNISSSSGSSGKSGISPSAHDSMSELFTIASVANEEYVYSRPQQDELLSVFISCYRTTDPVKALLNSALSLNCPVLSVLAVCFAEADVNECFIVYLYSLLSSTLCRKFHKMVSQPSNNKMDLAGLFSNDREMMIKKLVTLYLSNDIVDMLEESIQIFYKGHPFLNILTTFTNIKKGKYPVVGNSLFDNECSCLKKYLSKHCLLNKTAPELICTGLDDYLPSNHMRKMFLSYLVETSYANIIAIDWNLIYGMYQLLEHTSTVIKSHEMVSNLVKGNVQIVGEKILNFFIDINNFSAATGIAKLFGLKVDNIIVRGLEYEFQQKSEAHMEQFFRHCNLTVRQHRVHADCAVRMFLNLSDRVCDKYLEYLSLCSAMFWSNEESYAEHSASSGTREDIERKQWLSFAASNVVVNTSPPLGFAKWPWESDSPIEQMDYDFIVSRTLVRVEPLNDTDLRERATAIIEEFLDNDLIITALRISNMFGLDHKKSRDLLNIIKAASKITYSLSPFMFDQVEGFEVVSCATSSSSDPTHDAVKHPELEAAEIIQAVKNLCNDYCSNVRFKHKILTLCKVSELCSVSYLDLVRCESYEQILQYMLSKDKCDFDLAKDLINAVPIESSVVEDFMHKTVLSSLQCDNTIDSTYGFSAQKLSNDWIYMIGLIPSSTALGYRLLQGALLYKESSEDVYKDHSVSVELIIYAHKCFQSAASIEGIGFLLNECRPFVDSLVNFSLWSLMGKLLIGLRRYNELHYVIDILKERGEFEHLLRKISDKNFKTSGFDRTLVHYLKCKYPDDRETLKLVARHFLVHSEVAEMWETEAKELIDAALGGAICTSSEHAEAPNRVSRFFSYFSPQSKEGNDEGGSEVDFLKAADSSVLLEAMHCYGCAANCCLQGGMVIRAMALSRQAELTALQIALVQTAGSNGLALRILRVSRSTLSLILSQYLSVREIILVSKAYDVNIDWVSALFHHFIIKGRKTFLSNFILASKLTPDIVLGIVKRMEATKFDSKNVYNLSLLLKHIDDPELIYRVASQFRMSETLDSCLSSPSVDFLKDTTFKKGLSGNLVKRY